MSSLYFRRTGPASYRLTFDLVTLGTLERHASGLEIFAASGDELFLRIPNTEELPREYWHSAAMFLLGSFLASAHTAEEALLHPEVAPEEGKSFAHAETVLANVTEIPVEWLEEVTS